MKVHGAKGWKRPVSLTRRLFPLFQQGISKWQVQKVAVGARAPTLAALAPVLDANQGLKVNQQIALLQWVWSPRLMAAL